MRQHLITYGFKLTKHSGPEVFLDLMKNAKIVVTTSLHGSIFASKYEKCFWYIKGADHDPNDDRSTSLLAQLGLSERFVDREELMARDPYETINYGATKGRIDALVDESMTFLKKSLS